MSDNQKWFLIGGIVSAVSCMLIVLGFIWFHL